MEAAASKLVGTWKSDRTDVAGIESYGRVTMTFKSNGELLYTIHEADRDQVIQMTFRLVPGFIITDQPSRPSEQRVAYELEVDGRLRLTMDGKESRYTRVVS